jgi:hypothetical protein
LTAYLAGDVSACCIKNKLVTAVTTAGLLAGLFGSAFVPAARAAAGVPVWVLGGTGANLEATGHTSGTEEGTAALPYILEDTTVEDIVIDISDLKDEFGTLVTGTASLSASGDVLFDDSSAGSFNTGKTAGSVVIDGTGDVTVTVVESSATAYGTGTVTISLGGASKTIYYDILGPLASIVLTNGDEFTHLAQDKSGTADKLTYVEKDAAGSTLPASAVTAVTYKKDGAAAAATEALAAITGAGTTADGVYVERGTGAGKLTIGDGSCVSGDEGETHTIAIVISDITSNTISFVCTLGGDKAVITAAALVDNTLYAGGSSKVIYTFTDGTRKLGFGAAIGTMAVVAVDFPNSLDSAAGSTKSNVALGGGATWDATSLTVDKNGQATSANNVITAAAKVVNGPRMVELTIADSDLGATANVEKVIEVRYSIVDLAGASGTIARSVKRTVATADFGVGAANKKVAFTLENVRNGNVKTYYRRANASGVATFTLRFVGRFEVTAAFSDEVTDTVILRKR